MDPANPGARLIRLREELPLKQGPFGRACGIDPKRLSELEQIGSVEKLTVPHRTRLMTIGAALGLGRNDLIDYVSGQIELDELKRRQNPQRVAQPELLFTRPEEQEEPSAADPASGTASPTGTQDRKAHASNADTAIAVARPVAIASTPTQKPVGHRRRAIRLGGAVVALAIVAVLFSVFTRHNTGKRPLKPLRQLFVLNSTVAWATGFGGLIIKTTDGFQSWHEQETGTDAVLYGIVFADDGLRGWVVGERGTILRTVDGGQHWVPQQSGTSEELRGVWFASDGKTGWVVGKGTILQTTNAGETWERIGLKDSGVANKDIGVANFVWFLDGDSGWIGAEHGFLLRTQDGGQQWRSQRISKDLRRLWAVHFSDYPHGWSVAEDGELYETMDGNTWNQRPLDVTAPLTDVCFVKGDYGWIVGAEVILHTIDGGKSWKHELDAPGAMLTCVHMLDKQRGFAVGRRACPDKTKDEGIIMVRDANGWRFIVGGDCQPVAPPVNQ